MTVLIARSSFPALRSLAGRQVPSAPSLAVVALVVWTVPLWFAAAPVGAYRFDPAERRVSLDPRSEDATRWKASVWGPGESLTWRVLDDGGWSPHFADASQVVAKLSSAAAAWTEIPTADPCEGIELPGAPVVPGSWLGRPFRKTTLELRSLTDGGPVWLDWKEPYVHEGGSSVLDINIAAWRMAVDRGGVTHSLDLEWFEGARIHLVVRSLAGECPLVCSGAGCELLAP